MLLSKDVLFNEVLDDECFLFSLGGVDPEERVDFVDVAIHRLLVVERTHVHLKFSVPHELLWKLELGLQVLDEQARRNHQLAILDERVDHQLFQHLRKLSLEILLFHLLDLIKGNLLLLAFVLIVRFM